MIKFGERIRAVRKNAGCKQKEFCSLLDIPQSTLSAYETDKMQPTIASLIKIAAKFDVSLDWLCGIECGIEKNMFSDLKCCPHCGSKEFWVRAQYIGTSLFIYNAETKVIDDYDNFDDYASAPAYCRNCGEYAGDYAERSNGESWKELSEKAKRVQQELDKGQQKRGPYKIKTDKREVDPNGDSDAELSDDLKALLDEAEKDLQEIAANRQREEALRKKIHKKGRDGK